MADNRTMAEMLCAPTEWCVEAIVVPLILAEQFELKHSLINMMTSEQFFRLEKDNPHDHIRWGSPPVARKRTTAFYYHAWERYKDLLRACPHHGFTELHQLDTFYNALNPADQDSLNAAAGDNLLEKSPQDALTIIENKSNVRNSQSKPIASQVKACDINSTPVKAVEETCVTYGGAHPYYLCLATGGNTFLEFRDNIQGYVSAAADNYNQGNLGYHPQGVANQMRPPDQDSLNFAAGGNFLDKMPCGFLAIIESKSKVRYSCNKHVVAKVSTNTSTSSISPDVAELKDMVKALLLDKKSQNQSHAPVKVVEESCVTCGGTYSHRNCPATDGNVYRDNIQEFVSQASTVNYNQGNTSYRPPMMSNQIHPPGFPPEDFLAYVKANDAVMRNMQNQLTNLTELITKFVNSNSASSSSSGTLPSNTIANLKSDLKAITTRSGVFYDRPQIPPSTSFLPKSESPILNSEPVTSLISEPVIVSICALKPDPKSLIPYPSRRNDERNSEKANNQIEKFYQILKDMSFEVSSADSLILMP
nr:hypothetical protein [Tanacetum cinerariifolium]